MLLFNLKQKILKNESNIKIFSIKNFKESLRLDIVSNKYITLPFYVNSFIEYFKDESINIIKS